MTVPSIAGAKIYRVGGSVRDKLLGRAHKDEDFVVVGATEAGMLAAGHKKVGADFPVFLDSEGREFALARRERKTGAGHCGFAVEFDPSVTLAEDLGRRDLTINAMAEDLASGEIFDPFGGRSDLAARTLRHVSNEAFPEDPLRILRLARFAAQLGNFAVAPETVALALRMVDSGALTELTAERVFSEIDRAMRTHSPARFFRVLVEVGALVYVLPEVAALRGVPEPVKHHPEGEAFEHTMLVLHAASRIECGNSALAWCALCHDLGKAETPPIFWPRHPGHEERSARIAGELLDRLKAPRALRDAVVAVAAEHMRAKCWRETGAGRVLRMLERVGAFRSPGRFRLFQFLLRADDMGRDRPFAPTETQARESFFNRAFAAAASVRGRDVLAARADKSPGEWVGQVLTQERVRAIAVEKRKVA